MDKETKQKKGIFIKKAMKEVPKVIDFKKGKIRNRITENVFDIEDSVADNAKMIMLLTSIIMRIYESDFNKDNLSSDDKALIEFAFNKYKNTTTRLDLQFQSEGGTNLIEKLLNRQQTIANIIEEENNG